MKVKLGKLFEAGMWQSFINLMNITGPSMTMKRSRRMAEQLEPLMKEREKYDKTREAKARLLGAVEKDGLLTVPDDQKQKFIDETNEMNEVEVEMPFPIAVPDDAMGLSPANVRDLGEFIKVG